MSDGLEAAARWHEDQAAKLSEHRQFGRSRHLACAKEIRALRTPEAEAPEPRDDLITSLAEALAVADRVMCSDLKPIRNGIAHKVIKEAAAKAYAALGNRRVPDPRDEVIASLVGALKTASNAIFNSTEHAYGDRAFVEAVETINAALRLAETGEVTA